MLAFLKKKTVLKFFLPFLITSTFSALADTPLQAADKGRVVRIDTLMKEYGLYRFADSDYVVELSINGMGGYLDLSVKNKKDGSVILKNIADVSGASWIASDILVVTTSPIYGKPGLFQFSADTKRLVQLLKPEHRTAGYSDGTDYFELQRTESTEKKIYYYYGQDVDEIDFNNFRSPKHLRCIALDGSTC